MSDDKSKRGPADRQRINLNQDHEVRYWTRELGVGKEKLKAIVQRVGNRVDTVRAELRSR